MMKGKILFFVLLYFFIHFENVYAANTGTWFDGSNGRILMSTTIPPIGPVFTIETFFRWDGKKSVQYESFINRQKWGTQEWGFFLNTDNKQIGATISYDGKHAENGSVWMGENIASVLEQGKWNHVALVGTGVGGQLLLYLNGKLVDSTTQTGTPLLLTVEKPQISVGGLHQNATAEPFHGAVDEFRISSIDRYSGQTYQVPIGDLVADLQTVGLWHFDEGTGQSALDSSGHNYHGTMYSQDTVVNAHWVTGYPFSTSITSTPIFAPWDYSRDGKVTPEDIVILLRSFTSIFDYTQIISHFGE